MSVLLLKYWSRSPFLPIPALAEIQYSPEMRKALNSQHPNQYRARSHDRVAGYRADNCLVRCSLAQLKNTCNLCRSARLRPPRPLISINENLLPSLLRAIAPSDLHPLRDSELEEDADEPGKPQVKYWGTVACLITEAIIVTVRWTPGFHHDS